MRTRWTDVEHDAIVEESARLCRHEACLAEGLTIKDALYRAQALLPESRRKKRFTTFFQRALIKRVEQKIKDQLEAKLPPMWPQTRKSDQVRAIEDRLQQPAPASPVRAAPSAAPAAPPPAAAPSENGLDRIVTAVRDLGRQLGHELGEAFVQSLLDRIKAEPLPMRGNGGNGEHPEIPGTVRIVPPQQQPGHHHLKAEDSAPGLPKKFLRPRVTVGCLLANQQQDVMKAFPHIDFRFAPHERSSAAHDMASGSDCAFAMSKFISHAVDRALKTGAEQGNAEFVRIPGGISQLKQAIQRRYGSDAIESAKMIEGRTQH